MSEDADPGEEASVLQQRQYRAQRVETPSYPGVIQSPSPRPTELIVTICSITPCKAANLNPAADQHVLHLPGAEAHLWHLQIAQPAWLSAFPGLRPYLQCSLLAEQPCPCTGGVDRDKLRDISDRKREQRREVAPTQDSRHERDGRDSGRSDSRRTDHDRHHRWEPGSGMRMLAVCIHRCSGML